MTLEFQGIRFFSVAHMCDKIVEAWMSADGENSPPEIKRFLAESTDADLAQDCVEGWGFDRILDEDPDGEDQALTWMQHHDCTHDDLAKAFARFRVAFAALANDDE